MVTAAPGVGVAERSRRNREVFVRGTAFSYLLNFVLSDEIGWRAFPQGCEDDSHCIPLFRSPPLYQLAVLQQSSGTKGRPGIRPETPFEALRMDIVGWLP